VARRLGRGGEKEMDKHCGASRRGMLCGKTGSCGSLAPEPIISYSQENICGTKKKKTFLPIEHLGRQGPLLSMG